MGVQKRQLEEMARRLANTGAAMERAKKLCAASAITQTKRCFLKGTDPYGTAWAPLKFRSGTPLRDVGHLKNSISAQVTSSGFRIGTNIPYARTHQYGAIIRPKNAKALRFVVRNRGSKKRGAVFFARKVTIPARPFLPTEARGLPREWVDDFQRILKREIRRTLAGK